MEVGAADPTRANPDPNFAGPGARIGEFRPIEGSTKLPQHHRMHHVCPDCIQTHPLFQTDAGLLDHAIPHLTFLSQFVAEFVGTVDNRQGFQSGEDIS